MALTGTSRLGPLPLRLAIGAVLLTAGYMKIFGDVAFADSQFMTAVKGFGLPYPEVLAYVAAYGEFIGGAMLILGFAARLAALVNAGTMFVAVWKASLEPVMKTEGFLQAVQQEFMKMDGHGYAFPLVILTGCLCILFCGAGALSIDGFLAGRRSGEE